MARLSRATLRRSDGIAKAQTDTREYRLVELPNQMRALLISDPQIARDGAPGVSERRARPMDVEEEEEGEEEEGEDEEDGDEGEGDDDEDDEDDEDDDSDTRAGRARSRAGDDNGDDEGGKKAACALCLGVGYLCDPPLVDGLAHFTEHMLFMGTEPFPGENEWSEFLAASGGERHGGG